MITKCSHCGDTKYCGPDWTPVKEWPTEKDWFDGSVSPVTFGEVEIDHVPFRALSECPVCFAIVRDGKELAHKEWHIK